MKGTHIRIAPGEVVELSSPHDVVELALNAWTEENGQPPMGVVSNDINGWLCTVGDDRFDPNLARDMRKAARCGWILAINSSNPLNGQIGYLRHIGFDPKQVTFFGTGDGKELWARYKGGWLVYHAVPKAERDDTRRRVKLISKAMLHWSHGRGLTWRTAHPTVVDSQTCHNGHQRGIAANYVHDDTVSIQFRERTEDGHLVRSGTLTHLAEAELRANLRKHGMATTRIEGNASGAFIYAPGKVSIQHSKATLVGCIAHVLWSLYRRITLHGGDHKNEFGVEQLGSHVLACAPKNTPFSGRLGVIVLDRDPGFAATQMFAMAINMSIGR